MPFIVQSEMIAERSVHFVARLRDRGADGGRDARSLGPQRFHSLNRVFQDTALRPAPSGVRRTDHARFPIREEHRSAIGRHNAQREAGPCCYHGIGHRTTFRGIIPGLLNTQNIGRMHLMRRHNAGARGDRMRRRSPESGHFVGGARPTKPELMRAARRSEKAVRDAFNRRGAFDIEGDGHVSVFQAAGHLLECVAREALRFGDAFQLGSHQSGAARFDPTPASQR